MELDKDTIKALIKEAKQKRRSAQREFEATDDSEAMYAVDGWDNTIAFLKEKLS